MGRKAGRPTGPQANNPTGLSLLPLPPTDGELQAAERDVPIPHQTPDAGQDRGDSLWFLHVLDALGKARVERLGEQEGRGAAAHGHGTVCHLGQGPPHLVQQEHQRGQGPSQACQEGRVPHPVLPGKVHTTTGNRGLLVSWQASALFPSAIFPFLSSYLPKIIIIYLRDQL